jgi:hypothetical protein
VVAAARLALRGALAPHLLDLAVQPVDALAHAAAVHLDLRLARAARADAARLPLQVRPEPAQARQDVLVLGELDLELGLLGAGAAGEDVEDERRAVHDLAADLALEVALLRRRELLVEHDGVGALGLAHEPKVLDLAPADQERRRGPDALDDLLRHDGAARRVHELGQFGQVVVHGPLVGVAELHADDDGPLARLLLCLDQLQGSASLKAPDAQR